MDALRAFQLVFRQNNGMIHNCGQVITKAGTARNPKSCISSKLKGERKEHFPLTFELSPFSFNVDCTSIV